jgi:hypothetical protein
MELVVTKEVHKFIPPDESSIEFWLSNRQPDEWKRKQEVTGNINNNNLNMTPEDLKNLPFDELQNRIKSLAKDLSEAVVK